MPANAVDKPGRKVRLVEISADPPKWTTREKPEKRFVTLGKELFEPQKAMCAAKVTSVLVVLPANAKWYRILVVAESIVDALKRRRTGSQRTLADMRKARRAELGTCRAQKAAAKGAKSNRNGEANF